MSSTQNPPVDALLLAQALWSGDEVVIDILQRHTNPWEVSRQLAAWLRCAVLRALEYGGGEEYGDRHEFDVIGRWIQDVQMEVTQ